jgi:hypothetical protein
MSVTKATEEKTDLNLESDSIIHYADEGVPVEIPFLTDYPFEFEQFVSKEALTFSEKDREKWVNVTITHIPVESNVTIAHAEARCRFLGLEPTKPHVQEQKEILMLHQRKFKEVCKDMLERYWVLLANQLGIVYDSNKKIESWSHITAAMCQCQSVADVRKFLVLMYISFDFIENYRLKLTTAALRELGLRVLKPVISKKDTLKPRKKISCFERIATVIINNYRKSINRFGSESCGWTITIVRPEYVFTGNNDNEFRESRKIYDWMIMGEKVSFV